MSIHNSLHKLQGLADDDSAAFPPEVFRNHIYHEIHTKRSQSHGKPLLVGKEEEVSFRNDEDRFLQYHC